MFRPFPTSRTILVMFSILLALSHFIYPVYSAMNTNTKISLPLHVSPRAQPPELETVSAIDVSINVPEYVLVERVNEIELLINNTGESHREIIIKVESTLRYVEVVYPTHELTLRIPPKRTYALNILVRGIAEGEEILVITIIDLLVNHTYAEVVRLPVTTLKTVYIHAYGILNAFTLEINRRPVRLTSVQLCNISASHLRDNIYMVEIPKTYKECTLHYEFPFIEDSFEVSLVEDTIYLTVIDTESNLSITIIAAILLIPALLLLSLHITEEGDDALFIAFMGFAILVSLATTLPPLFTILGLGFLVLIFDLVVILGSFGFFHLVYYLIVFTVRLIYRMFSLVGRGIRRAVINVRKKANKEKTYRDTASHRDMRAVEDEHLELINAIKNYRIPNPSKRRPVESVMVPDWLRNSLKKVGKELPSEMHLVDCGYLGCVYECGPYAIKIPKTLKDYLRTSDYSPPMINKDLATKLEREVLIVAKLNHDNILKLLDYSVDPPVLVYELADGSLQMYERLEFKDILAIAVQLCEGLRYLHTRGIVHGDIKPSNILIAKGAVKIGDLTSVTYLIGTVSKSTAAHCTPGYCAPEQVFVDMRFDKRREGYENRVDVYQLANVILFMLGIKPIDATDLSYIEVSRRLKDVKISELQSLLRDMLSPYPWQRPSVDEVEKRLLYIWKSTSKDDRNNCKTRSTRTSSRSRVCMSST